MLLLHFCAFCWLLPVVFPDVIDGLEPGQCLSKFDYDFKIIQTLSRLEEEIVEMRKKLQSFEGNIGNLKEKETIQSAFMAQLSSNMVNPPKNTVVVFDSVQTNIGNDYKAHSGIYIATIPGTYCFHLVATSAAKPRGHLLHLYMMHNDDRVGYIFLDGNDQYSLIRSTNTVVALKSGDTVFVKIANTHGTGTLNGNGFHTHFSGFRICGD